MSDLSSPSSIRLVAAAAAAVASLGVVALGVQLGTSGLVGDGPGRNPGSAAASPASATVDLPRSRRAATLEQLLIALAPELAASTGGSSSATPATPPASAAATTPAGPPAPRDDGAAPPPPPPSPSPIPTPVPTPTIPAPVPAPTVPPALDPIVEPIADVVEGVGVVPPANDPASSGDTTTSLEGIVQLLLGS